MIPVDTHFYSHKCYVIDLYNHRVCDFIPYRNTGSEICNVIPCTYVLVEWFTLAGKKEIKQRKKCTFYFSEGISEGISISSLIPRIGVLCSVRSRGWSGSLCFLSMISPCQNPAQENHPTRFFLFSVDVNSSRIHEIHDQFMNFSWTCSNSTCSSSGHERSFMNDSVENKQKNLVHKEIVQILYEQKFNLKTL
jgi:hypothetical protein